MPTNDSNESRNATDPAGDSQGGKNMSSRQAYNVVADTVAGLNIRKSDNLFQLKCIGICALLLSVVGAIVALRIPDAGFPWYGGAIVGAVGGVVIGVFGSGIFLMIFRFVRHVSGKHD
jgi:hypothetical protein